MLATEQVAAKEFLRSVLRTGDQAFVMDFDVDVKLLQDFTGTPSELARAVDSAEINQTGRSVLQEGASRSSGGTHLYDTVYLASNELMKQRLGRKVLVLVTDGEDQGSRSSLQESIESAEKANVIVYSIIVSDPEFYTLLGGTYHGDASARKASARNGRPHDSRKIDRTDRAGVRPDRRRASRAISAGLFPLKSPARWLVPANPRQRARAQRHGPHSHRLLRPR